MGRGEDGRPGSRLAGRHHQRAGRGGAFLPQAAPPPRTGVAARAERRPPPGRYLEGGVTPAADGYYLLTRGDPYAQAPLCALLKSSHEEASRRRPCSESPGGRRGVSARR